MIHRDHCHNKYSFLEIVGCTSHNWYWMIELKIPTLLEFWEMLIQEIVSVFTQVNILVLNSEFSLGCIQIWVDFVLVLIIDPECQLFVLIVFGVLFFTMNLKLLYNTLLTVQLKKIEIILSNFEILAYSFKYFGHSTSSFTSLQLCSFPHTKSLK